MIGHILGVAGIGCAERTSAEKFGDCALFAVREILRLRGHNAGGERRVDGLGSHLRERFGVGGRAAALVGVFVGARHGVVMAARTVFVEDSLADDSRHRADERPLRLRARRLRRGLPGRWLLRGGTLLLRGGAETEKREREARRANQS